MKSQFVCITGISINRDKLHTEHAFYERTFLSHNRNVPKQTATVRYAPSLHFMHLKNYSNLHDLFAIFPCKTHCIQFVLQCLEHDKSCTCRVSVSRMCTKMCFMDYFPRDIKLIVGVKTPKCAHQHRALPGESITYYPRQNGGAWKADSESFCGCFQNKGLIISKLPRTSVVLCWKKQLTKYHIRQ